MRSHGKRKNWVVLYREAGVRKYYTVGLYSKLSKSQAQQMQAAFMQEVNARAANAPDPLMTLGTFLMSIALPFYRRKWKRSTAETTESRMTHHLAEFHDTKLQSITLNALQDFLNKKAKSGLSRSVVAHLRWDLRAIFRLALAEGYALRDPTAAARTHPPVYERRGTKSCCLRQSQRQFRRYIKLPVIWKGPWIFRRFTWN